MSSSIYLYGVPALVMVLIAVITVVRRIPRPINAEATMVRWRSLQKKCANKKTWHTAVVEADQLLDDVLKRRHYRGKSTGERLVAAQRHLSSNDTVWFGHKLRNRIVQDDLKKLSKLDTLEALGGFRQALKDLGALVDDPGVVDE